MRDLPGLKSLRAFEAAARGGSLTAAADELCVGQGAISHQIRLLEDYLGLRVFIRRQHGVELTQEGTLLFTSCQRAFDDLAGTIRHISPRNAQKILRVKVGPFFSMKIIAPRISEFLAQHPGLQLHLSHLDTNVPASGQPDIVIDYRLGAVTGKFSRQLLRERLVPVCGASIRNQYDSVAELLCSNRLHYRSVSEWQSWIATSGLMLGHSQQDLIFDDQHIILEAVKEGQGVALIDQALVEQELRTGQMVLVSEHSFEPQETYQFVCQEDLFRSKPVTKDFLDWLLREVALRRKQQDSAALCLD